MNTFKTYETCQVFYSNWSQKLKKGDENYWWTIATIADWIGHALEGSRRIPGQQPIWASTIGVVQTKEKFGQVRVYCYFALSEAVEAEYKLYVSNIKEENSKYYDWKSSGQQAHIKKEEYESGKYPIKLKTIEDFSQECYFKDLRHYREVYYEAFKLWPQYESAIRAGADFSEYLLELDEVDAYFDFILDSNLKWYRESSTWSDQGENGMRESNLRRKNKVKNILDYLNNGEENA